MKFYLFAFLLITTSLAGQNYKGKHELLNKVLKEHVEKGLVDYETLKADNRLAEYINYVSKINPDTLSSKNDKLSYYINVYNAYTLKLIVDNYPVESINDIHWGGQIIGHILGTTVWDDEFVIVNGKKTTLNNIEHEIIRKKFDEPRIHFALVCAAVSCPPLREEAYEGYKLDKQLQDQAVIFLNNEGKNQFNVENKEAKLSKILDWYEEDFGEDKKETLLYISRFLTKEVQEDIRENLERWTVDYLDYNWKLNVASNKK